MNNQNKKNLAKSAAIAALSFGVITGVINAAPFSTTAIAAENTANQNTINTLKANFKQVDPTKAKAWENIDKYGSDTYRIALNEMGVKDKLTDKVLILNNRTFLPLRAFGDLIGATTSWDETNKVAKIEFTSPITGKTTTIEAINNSNKIIVNGSETAEVSKGDPSTATFISPTNNRMYLPIRAIAENLDGVEIKYYEYTQGSYTSPKKWIKISTNGSKLPDTLPVERFNDDETFNLGEFKPTTYKGTKHGELSKGGGWVWDIVTKDWTINVGYDLSKADTTWD